MATWTLHPNANGDSVAWTKSGGTYNYEMVDEDSHDDDTTYVTGTPSGETDYYNIESPSGAGTETINSVKVYVWCRQGTIATTATYAIGLRLGGVDSDGTTQTPTANYGEYSETISRPGGGNWTYSDLADLQIKLKVVYAKSTLPINTFSNILCTQVYIVVDYSEAILYKIRGYVKEYSTSTPVEGVKITYHIDNVASSGAYSTDSSGEYVLNIDTGRALMVTPSYRDWAFHIKDRDTSPGYYKWAGTTDSAEVDFVLGPESWWQGYDGRLVGATATGLRYAFRKRIEFSTPHPELPKDYICKVPFVTGQSKEIGVSNAHYGESIQINQIAYRNGITFIVYRGFNKTAGLYYGYGVKYYHDTDAFSTVYSLFKMSDSFKNDSHRYPSIAVDSRGYIHVVKNGHNDNATYYRSKSPYDFSAFQDTAEIFWAATYVRLQCDSRDNVWFSYRDNVSGGTNAYGNWSYNIRYADGNWRFLTTSYCQKRIARFQRTIAGGDPVGSGYQEVCIYSNGFQINESGGILGLDHKEDIIQLNLTFNENYLWSPQYGHGGVMLYAPIHFSSPTSSTSRPTNLSGRYWYTHGNATCIAIVTANTTDPLTWNKCTAVPSMVVGGWPFMYAPSTTVRTRTYGGNAEQMFCDHTDMYYTGLHTIPRAWMSMQISECVLPSAASLLRIYTGAIKFNDATKQWDIYNLTTAVAGQKLAGSSANSKGRGCNPIFIDKSPYIYIYGMRGLSWIDASMKQEDGHWGDGYLMEWISKDHGLTWQYRKITGFTGWGYGLVSGKKDLSNNTIEFVTGDTYDVTYHKLSNTVGKMLPTCDDVRVYYGPTEIDRVSNLWTSDDTEVYFKLQHTVQSVWEYDTAYNYYIYYGMTYSSSSSYAASVPLANAENIYGLYESFEGYTASTYATSNGRWAYWSSSGTVCFNAVVGNEGDQWVYSGGKGLKISSLGNSGSFDIVNYLYTSLPTDLRNNMRADISMWFGDQGAAPHHYCGLAYGTTVIGIGSTHNFPQPDDRWSYWTNRGKVSYSDIISNMKAYQAVYHRVSFTTRDGVVSIYAYDSCIARVCLPAGREVDKFIMGTGGTTGYTYFDFLRISKTIFE